MYFILKIHRELKKKKSYVLRKDPFKAGSYTNMKLPKTRRRMYMYRDRRLKDNTHN